MHLPHPPWQVLWRVRLKSRSCIIHECWWISISDTTLTYCWEHLCPYSVLHEKRGSIWWPWRSCICTTVLEQAQPWTIIHMHSFLHEDIHNVAHNQNLKLEFAGNIYRNLYSMYCISSMVSLPCTPSGSHSLLFSQADPISAVRKYRVVMMRNGVIMPVVKPQATQQMCFRDPAFVSEWIRSLLW